ncbi:non-oxidative hydroxyarylic acid decarboxylases subunit D [Streptomyces sp. L7]
MIVVDEDVDPFDLPQVMWAMSAKVNPQDDVVIVPNLSVMSTRTPAANAPGITSKMIIDATTPVAPDNRGHFDTPVRDLPETPEWDRPPARPDCRPLTRPALHLQEPPAMICPRCAHDTVDTVSTSPVPGVWDAPVRPLPLHVAHLTEPDRRTRREAYPDEFRMTPADIEAAPEVPVVPPLL